MYQVTTVVIIGRMTSQERLFLPVGWLPLHFPSTLQLFLRSHTLRKAAFLFSFLNLFQYTTS